MNVTSSVFFQFFCFLIAFTASLVSSQPVRAPISRNLNDPKLDEKYLERLSHPRCGVTDTIAFHSNSRSQRWAMNWNFGGIKKNLTYKILKYSNKLDAHQIDVELARAFNMWSEHTNYMYTHKREGQVDIEIAFLTFDHGDIDPFDGAGGVLAHANYYYNAIHFDDSENWTFDGEKGINFFQVALHEIGHVLGLDHSNVSASVMYKHYRGFKPNYHLHDDDIKRIKAVYSNAIAEEQFYFYIKLFLGLMFLLLVILICIACLDFFDCFED